MIRSQTAAKFHGGNEMFFMPVFDTILWVYLIAALAPAIYLMSYIYRQDTIEKEPAGLLWGCVGRGVLAALLSIILETIGQRILNVSQVNQNTLVGVMILNFVVVGAVEEGTKYALMGKYTWNKYDFNCRFDGIVYAAFTSLGFAAFENIEYVFQYGLSVALPRAFLSIPGHLGFSVIFGCFYGRARLAANQGRRAKMYAEIIVGYLLAVLLHGTYDTCATIQSSTSTLTFIGVVVILYIIVFRLVKHESRTDEFID